MSTRTPFRSFARRAGLPTGVAAILLALGAPGLGAQDTAIVVTPTRPAPAGPPAAPGRPSEVLVGSGPNGATLRCRDGSYPAALATDSACEGKGGVLVRFPLQRTPANGPALRRTSPHPVPADSAPAPALRIEPTPDRSKVIVPASLPPANATLQCGDGTFIVSDTSSVRCAQRGGVAMIIPQRRRP